MIKGCIVFLLCVTVIALNANAELEMGSTLNPVLTWKAGDKWQVRTWYAKVRPAKKRGEKDVVTRKGKAIEVQFEVIGIKINTGLECYEVNVIYPKDGLGFQHRNRLYYSKQQGNLIQVVDNSLRSDGSELNEINNFNYTNAPTLANNIRSSIPFDFPLFAEAGNELMLKEGACETQQKMSLGKDESEFETVITTMDSRQVQPTERKVVQKWRKGKPWWIEAKVYVNGDIRQEAELIMDEKEREPSLDR